MPKVIYEMGGVSADRSIVGPDGKSDWSCPTLRRLTRRQGR